MSDPNNPQKPDVELSHAPPIETTVPVMNSAPNSDLALLGDQFNRCSFSPIVDPLNQQPKLTTINGVGTGNSTSLTNQNLALVNPGKLLPTPTVPEDASFVSSNGGSTYNFQPSNAPRHSSPAIFASQPDQILNQDAISNSLNHSLALQTLRTNAEITMQSVKVQQDRMEALMKQQNQLMEAVIQALIHKQKAVISEPTKQESLLQPETARGIDRTPPPTSILQKPQPAGKLKEITSKDNVARNPDISFNHNDDNIQKGKCNNMLESQSSPKNTDFLIAPPHLQRLSAQYANFQPAHHTDNCSPPVAHPNTSTFRNTFNLEAELIKKASRLTENPKSLPQFAPDIQTIGGFLLGDLMMFIEENRLTNISLISTWLYHCIPTVSSHLYKRSKLKAKQGLKDSDFKKFLVRLARLIHGEEKDITELALNQNQSENLPAFVERLLNEFDAVAENSYDEEKPEKYLVTKVYNHVTKKGNVNMRVKMAEAKQRLFITNVDTIENLLRIAESAEKVLVKMEDSNSISAISSNSCRPKRSTSTSRYRRDSRDRNDVHERRDNRDRRKSRKHRDSLDRHRDRLGRSDKSIERNSSSNKDFEFKENE